MENLLFTLKTPHNNAKKGDWRNRVKNLKKVLDRLVLEDFYMRFFKWEAISFHHKQTLPFNKDHRKLERIATKKSEIPLDESLKHSSKSLVHQGYDVNGVDTA